MKKISRAIFILTLVFTCVICIDTAGAATYFIKQNGNGDSSSWENASGNLKSVLDNANAGDVIYVSSGDYSPGTNANVRALSSGTAVIWAKGFSANGIVAASCTVTVKENPPAPPVDPFPHPPVKPDGTPDDVESVKPELPVILPENPTDEQKNRAIEDVSDLMPTIEPSNLEVTDGIVTVNRELAISLAQELMPKYTVIDAVTLPVFKAALQNFGGTVMTAFAVNGEKLFALDAKDINLLKIISSDTAEFFTYTDKPAEFTDKFFTIMNMNDGIVNSIDACETYKLVLFVKDGVHFGLDGAENGNVIDPIAVINAEPKNAPSKGSGCAVANIATFVILLIAPLFKRKK